MNKALVIDDARTVRQYHRELLESVGYAVHEAFNGIEALEICGAETFDLLVVDVNMPKLNGYDFLQSYRERDDGHAVAIMVTTEARPDDALQAMQAGANLHLVKPVNPETLKQLAQLLRAEEAA